MSASGYTAWSVTAGEVPTTAFWNILGSNDASFNNGNGINDGAILTRHLAAHNATNTTALYNETQAAGSLFSITTTWTTITNWGSASLVTNGGDIILHTNFSFWSSAVGPVAFRIMLNSSAWYPSTNGWTFYVNAVSTHVPAARAIRITGLVASTYTVAVQGLSQNGGNLNFDAADYLSMTAVEYLR